MKEIEWRWGADINWIQPIVERNGWKEATLSSVLQMILKDWLLILMVLIILVDLNVSDFDKTSETDFALFPHLRGNFIYILRCDYTNDIEMPHLCHHLIK